jgi:hypothetical protein
MGMDAREIVGKIKSGNVQEIDAVLRELFSSFEGTLSKDLFEALYDLKFHSDMGVKFWAKKVLNTFELKGKKDENRRPPATPIDESPLPEEESADTGAAPADAAVPPAKPEAPAPAKNRVIDVSDLCRRFEEAPESLTFEDLSDLCDARIPQMFEPLLGYLQECHDIQKLSYLTKQLGKAYPREELYQHLAPFLKHEDVRIIANTVEGLAALGSPKVFVILAQMLEHPDNRVRSNVAVAVGQFDKDQAYSILEKMISLAGKAHMQASACHAIKELDDPRFFPLLKPIMTDELLLPLALQAFEERGDSTALLFLLDVLEAMPAVPVARAILATCRSIVVKATVPASAHSREKSPTDGASPPSPQPRKATRPDDGNAEADTEKNVMITIPKKKVSPWLF